MAATTQIVISFARDDTKEVEAAMARLSARGDGEGWINVGPALTEEQHQRVPVQSTIGSWFTARGPVVPMATWTPQVTSGRPRPVVIGVEHGVGPKALDQLREAGLPLPSGWRKVQDHAKRGIVLNVADKAAHAEVLSWLVDACWALCGIDIDDHWSAVVNTPES